MSWRRSRPGVRGSLAAPELPAAPADLSENLCRPEPVAQKSTAPRRLSTVCRAITAFEKSYGNLSKTHCGESVRGMRGAGDQEARGAAGGEPVPMQTTPPRFPPSSSRSLRRQSSLASSFQGRFLCSPRPRTVSTLHANNGYLVATHHAQSTYATCYSWTLGNNPRNTTS